MVYIMLDTMLLVCYNGFAMGEFVPRQQRGK